MADKHRRRRPPEPEPQDEFEGIDWDDTVDVVCVGVGVAATAAAVAAVRLGLTVLRATPAAVDEEQTAEYLRQVTDDIVVDDIVVDGIGVDGIVPAEFEADVLPLRRVEGPVPHREEFAKGAVSFDGAALRNWAAQCLPAGGGVLSTAVADPNRTTVSVGVVDLRSEAGTVADWVAEQARQQNVPRVPVENLAHLVFDDGCVAGVALTTDSGIELVRARQTVVLALRDDAVLAWPPDTDDAEVAFVTRAASRFGRLELLVRDGSLPR